MALSQMIYFPVGFATKPLPAPGTPLPTLTMVIMVTMVVIVIMVIMDTKVIMVLKDVRVTIFITALLCNGCYAFNTATNQGCRL